MLCLQSLPGLLLGASCVSAVCTGADRAGVSQRELSFWRGYGWSETISYPMGYAGGCRGAGVYFVIRVAVVGWCWCKRPAGSSPVRELAVPVRKGRGGSEWDPVTVKIVFNSVYMLTGESILLLKIITNSIWILKIV